MSGIHAIIALICVIAIGISFILIGGYVISTYSESFRRNPKRLMLWDVLSALITGPWSMPLALAATIIAFGAVALFIGGSILMHIVLLELSH